MKISEYIALDNLATICELKDAAGRLSTKKIEKFFQDYLKFRKNLPISINDTVKVTGLKGSFDVLGFKPSLNLKTGTIVFSEVELASKDGEYLAVKLSRIKK